MSSRHLQCDLCLFTFSGVCNLIQLNLLNMYFINENCLHFRMSEGTSCCEKNCNCKVTRKRIVMTIMAICCFVLTAWTVVITGQAKGSVPQNVSLVFIDDSKTVDNLNITLSSRVSGTLIGNIINLM